MQIRVLTLASLPFTLAGRLTAAPRSHSSDSNRPEEATRQPTLLLDVHSLAHTPHAMHC